MTQRDQRFRELEDRITRAGSRHETASNSGREGRGADTGGNSTPLGEVEANSRGFQQTRCL